MDRFKVAQAISTGDLLAEPPVAPGEARRWIDSGWHGWLEETPVKWHEEV